MTNAELAQVALYLEDALTHLHLMSDAGADTHSVERLLELALREIQKRG